MLAGAETLFNLIAVLDGLVTRSLLGAVHAITEELGDLQATLLEADAPAVGAVRVNAGDVG